MTLETFPLLDRESRRRIETDTEMSFGLYLVLSFITFGIYAIYAHYKLIQREQEHFDRMTRFNDDLYKLVEEQSEDAGKAGEVSAELAELRGKNEDFQRLQAGKERSAALWTIISIITLGLGYLYVYYFLHKDLIEHQRSEAEYIEKASALLNRLGVGKHPVVVEQVVGERSYALYLLLSIVTFGLFGIYWNYTFFKDGNEHFLEHRRFEDQLMSIIRTAA
ncbi:MAG: DUF4234 domain-containing protein [Solirubrobacterales bacterium]